MSTTRILRILGLCIFMLGGVTVSNKTQAQPGVSISFQTFYEELSPYGRWVRNPQFGSIWVPDVPRGFQPYSTNGYWEVTEYGNTWVSDYDWGWAPFHYGRWSFDDYVGWFWVPDYEWGPAWVNWRSGGGYYGWAPLGPGVNINVSVNIPSFWWVFVPQRYVTYRNWYNYCPPRRRVTNVYNQTVIINNYYRSNNRTYVYGPRRDEIERVTRRSVPVRTIDATPSGRGRVIVAGNSRGDNRYDSRGDDRGARYEPNRRGSVIDANRNGRGDNDNSSRDRGNNDFDRNDRISSGRVNENADRRDERINNARISDNSDRGDRSPVDRSPGDRINNAPRNPVEAPDNMRRGRTREAEPSFPSDNRSNNRYEAPRQPDRSSREVNPGFGSERSARPSRSNDAPVNPGRGSYEAPQRSSRQERSAPEPRNNGRSSQESAPRGASERSGRGPR
ncbi:DUF6600 domain-containing protein [Dyadobacter sp. Leaf189]|uniref:DUF6600 domain-containing protein n=1 Tax=Dyadobacter sp. Leaf189 TaxID=1736295 RepID=UPI0006F42FB2|nr:DUF6600 domain-containing protein [Dyadobacter sp. Leaf189]KQS33297.1 hypothetical protein ASG33_04230 [Dyadobacter sp. Leaf189]